MGFSDEVIEVLKEGLPVYHRKGQGGTFPYVKGEDVIKQLNKAFGHAWSSRVVSHNEAHGQVLVLVELSVSLGDKDVVMHQGFGSSRIAKNSQTNEVLEIGNSYKSAYTAGLKKAAEQFGVGLESEEDGETSKPAPQQGSYQPRPQFTPRAQQSPQRPQQVTPRPPMQSRPAQTPAPAPQAPRTPPASEGLVSNTKPLSDVQKNALKNLASVRGHTEEELVRGALNSGDRKSDKTRFDQLTGQEAVDVIRYVNTFSKKVDK